MICRKHSAACLRRFAGVRALYGLEGFGRLQAAEVLVAGCGGVGSWLAEALCRTAVGRLVLLDPDIIALDNSNRQLHTLSSTLGRSKAQVLAERLLDINPELAVQIITQRLTPSNLEVLLSPCPHYVAEAIDDGIAKAALLNYLYHHNASFISAGGAGGRTDPSHIQVADLAQSRGNALLAKLRHDLRKNYGFPGAGSLMGIRCVFSTEPAIYARDHREEADLPRFGAALTVTASCGLRMAACLIQDIISGT